MTYSDYDKEEESNDDKEFENFAAFMTTTIEATKRTSKELDNEKLVESDGISVSQEEDSDEEDNSDLQQAYN